MNIVTSKEYHFTDLDELDDNQFEKLFLTLLNKQGNV